MATDLCERLTEQMEHESLRRLPEATRDSPQGAMTQLGFAMPPASCSNCGQLGRLLEFVSRNTWVDYYRCESCGLVWVIDKSAHCATKPRVVIPAIEP